MMKLRKKDKLDSKEALKIFGHSILLICFLIIYSCAKFNPRPLDEVPFRERAQTQYEKNVRVTAVVLSAEETQAIFDAPLYKKGIQPLWLEIENNEKVPLAFLPVGLDRDYFAPLEVAYVHRYRFVKEANRQMRRHFYEQALDPYIPAGSLRSGFVFTNLDLGTKNFNVDLFGGDHRLRTFTFFIAVPGLRVDHREVDWESLYSKNEIISYNEEELLKVLEELPCCVTNQDGTKKGDPLNLVIIGKGKDVHHALIRSGWHETATVPEPNTPFKDIFPSQYRYVPVKPLYLYGRHQDAAFRKIRETANERNQLRFWLSPMLLEGTNVWVGQISRIVRRFAVEKFRIEPDVDEVRAYIFQDLLYSQVLAKYTFVKGVGAATMLKPHKGLLDDPYFTDGRRMVLWISGDPVSFSEVERVKWDIPPGE
jgi:hypothetical protein